MMTVAMTPTTKDRLALYEPLTHKVTRFMFVPIITGWAIAFAAFLFSVLTKGATKSDLVMLAFAPVFALGAWTALRPRAIYGTRHGLQYKHKGKWRVAPWTAVGVPEFAPWSWGFFVRIATVEITEDGTKTLWFYATDGYLEDFRRMREGVAVSRDATPTA